MNREEFKRLRDAHYETIAKINDTKGKDYAGDADALANFKNIGADLGLDPMKIWGVYASKHWSAVMAFIREGKVESEPIEGRLHDVILYCFLLLGLIEEQKQQKQRAELLRAQSQQQAIQQQTIRPDTRDYSRRQTSRALGHGLHPADEKVAKRSGVMSD